MALATFDTLEFVDELEKSGIPENQARAISAAVRKVYESSGFATKRDIDDLRSATKRDIDDLRKDIDTKLANMKFELLKWFFGIALAQTGLLISLKLFA